MGFGAASNHTIEDILLNIFYVFLNVFTFFLIRKAFNIFRNKELLLTSFLTLAVWVALYFYYNYPVGQAALL